MAMSSQEADRIPTGDLELGLCPRCGFLQNIRFDPSLQEQTIQYEDSQAASPTFGSFARDIAKHLVARYDLEDKNVIEIGCGQGEFLALLCEVGGCTGVGIDPLAVGSRVANAGGSSVTFLGETFSEKHADLPVDLICCRHTLEHIQPVGQFLQTVRKAIGTRAGVSLFFEVPDVKRILEENAFWDIYYEHCSYFSAGSMGRLFRSCGFEVLDLRRGFGDQYLLLEARPVGVPPEEAHPEEESPEDQQQLAAKFRKGVIESVAAWKTRFERFGREGGGTALWGSGSKAVAFLSGLGLHEEIDYVVDIDPRKQGRFLPGTGHGIVAPETLCARPVQQIIVMNPVYMEEIRANVRALGLELDLIPLGI
jgi:SAM-dependent methyltransferase